MVLDLLPAVALPRRFSSRGRIPRVWKLTDATCGTIRQRRSFHHSTVSHSAVNPLSVALRRRNLKLTKNILLLISIFCAGDLSHLIVLLWERATPSSAPKHLYFSSSNATISLFFREKEMKGIVSDELSDDQTFTAAELILIFNITIHMKDSC